MCVFQDLEGYINNYTGMARLLRLLHIADHCPSLRVEALKMAIIHVQSTYNVSMYQQLHKKLREAVTWVTNYRTAHSKSQRFHDYLPFSIVCSIRDGNFCAYITSRSFPLPDVTGGSGAAPSDLPQVDLAWIEQKSKKASLKLEKLDADLKNYKSNSIKESIRRGHDDLAEHYLETGDLTNALKCFSRARDYCTSAKHVINMCLNVIKVN